ALPVASRRPHGEVDLGQVALVEADEALRKLRRTAEQDEKPARGARRARAEADEARRKLRRTAEQDEQQAGGEGIERAGVPGARAGPLPQISDDREGRWTVGLGHE